MEIKNVKQFHSLIVQMVTLIFVIIVRKGFIKKEILNAKNYQLNIVNQELKLNAITVNLVMRIEVINA